MRRNLEDVRHIVTDKKYPNLPEELREFNYYLLDSGHSLTAIPEALLPQAEKDGDLDMYECVVPVRYALKNGYRIYKGYLIIKVDYDEVMGVDIPDEYYEH